MVNPSSISPSRVLVTGIHGFTGKHLAKALLESGYEVHGTVASFEPDHTAEAYLHVADLLDLDALRDVITEVRPTYVVHLAAISFVAHGSAREMYLTNIVGTRNLLQALDESAVSHLGNVLLASSANIYGNVSVDPICETHAPNPVNDYGVSKLSMEHMAALWFDRLPITIVRPFNYTGVGQPENFLLPKIVTAFRKRTPVLELGNIDVERDFCDVRDAVSAYCGLLEQPAERVLNICSGRAHSIAEVIQMITDISGHRIKIRTNPAFVRASEVRRLRGSTSRLRSALGEWNPRPLEETLAWMFYETEASDESYRL